MPKETYKIEVNDKGQQVLSTLDGKYALHIVKFRRGAGFEHVTASDTTFIIPGYSIALYLIKKPSKYSMKQVQAMLEDFVENTINRNLSYFKRYTAVNDKA